ncbi:MAG: hypothetical protein SPG67_04470 [Sodaliphilus sp.]|nr:hypothetical protein [Sodaliphilus sp.]
MKCYCPKCGRENEVSVADLRRQKGTVVCPKCLTTFQMPYANSNDDGDDTPPPIPKRRAKASAPKPAARRTTAAPRKAATAKQSTPPPVPSRTSRTSANPRPAAKRKPSQPMSKAGCVLTTICITAGFFLLYTLVGLIFDKM